MKVTYTGKQKELLPAQMRKLEARIAKIGKLVDTGKREQEAHVIYRSEKHLIEAEITVAYYDHNVVGVASGTDQFTALCDAFDKLEKQVLKLRTKWRDTKRGPKEFEEEEAEESDVSRATEAELHDEDGAPKQRVFRVNHHNRRKPMTLEEAILEMEKDRDYVVYFDAETDKLSVLVRRRDGNFDLIED